MFDIVDTIGLYTVLPHDKASLHIGLYRTAAKSTYINGSTYLQAYVTYIL